MSLNSFLKVAAVLAVTLAMIVPASAQYRDFMDEIPADQLRPTRTLSADSLAFCVNMTSMMTEFDLELAGMLADALLLDHQIVEVHPPTPSRPYDFRVPLLEGEIYLFLAHHCDAFLGFTALATYPDWLRATTPYLATRTVLAVRQGEFPGFRTLGPGQMIGTRLGSLADGYLTTYNRTLARASQLNRVVYPSNESLIVRLLDRSVDAVLIWEPAILAYREANPQSPGIDLHSDMPFSIPPTEFVLAIRGSEDFLTLSLTQAVEELVRIGAVTDLAIKHGILPAGP